MIGEPGIISKYYRDRATLDKVLKQPLLSVIVPVFNRENYIRQCVLSLLADPYPKEIIVIDDKSTDETIEAVVDLPIIIQAREVNGGPAASRNDGLRRASGGFITFVDSDDCLDHEGCQWRMAWLAENSLEQAVWAGLITFIDEHSKKLPFSESCPYRLSEDINRLSFSDLKSGQRYFPTLWNGIFKADLLKKVGFFDEGYRIADDLDYFIRILKHASVPVLRKHAIIHRLHSRNLCRDFDPKSNTTKTNVLARAEACLARIEHGLTEVLL